MLEPSLQALHESLGIPQDFAAGRELPEFAETAELVEVGPNLVGRMQRLTPLAAERWQAMQRAGSGDGP